MRDELPVPDFSPVSPPTSRVSLWLLEWNGDPRDAIALLVQMGVPDAEARRALTQLPAQLLSDVDEGFARTIADAMAARGGRSTFRPVRASSGRQRRLDTPASVPPSEPRPFESLLRAESGPPSVAPPPPHSPLRSSAHPVATHASSRKGPTPAEVGFWPKVPVAFVVPFLGAGWMWLVAITVGNAFLHVLPSFRAIMLLPRLALIGALMTYFARAFRVGTSDDRVDGLPDASSFSSEDNASGGLLSRGLGLLLTLVVFGGLAYVISEYTRPPIRGPLALGFLLVAPFYFLMTVAHIALSGSALAVLHSPQIVVAMVNGGLRFLFVGMLSVVHWLGLFFAVGLVGLFDVDSLGLGVSTTLWLGLAYAFGVQGYLMGRLVDVQNGEL
ncbi:MAG: hypothetical protein H6721_20470 [Sandaracinus sp.]|nr:hypothetical protein [Sandaracinus sp.]MCB9613005.1 hypothetical protein [Sandaracinus sp.]MCB9622271.1 hypothetical protein [Sandaracinus sp.]MCB9634505.1 hypothetical protein [Sandaracinus sp.]